MAIYWSLFVAIVGAIVYLITVNPKLQQLSLWAWGVGLLAFLLSIGTRTVGILGK